MEIYKVTVVLDSNIILEGLPLAQLPWQEIDETGPILVLLMPTLLREVDSKKRDGRIGARAREFNRFVDPLVTSESKINLIEGPPRIDIAIATCNRIDWREHDDLDSSAGDVRLIVEAFNVRDVKKEDLIIVSQDIYPLHIAKRLSLKTKRVSDRWLLQLEPSAQEKENAKLKRKLAELQRTEPELDVKIDLDANPLPAICVREMSADDIAKFSKSILRINPKVLDNKRSLADFSNDYSYDRRYEEYKSVTVPRFVNSAHQKLELLYGQVPFSISVRNSGHVPANRLKIEVKIVGGLMNFLPIYVDVLGPSAPAPKRYDFQTPHFPNFRNQVPPAIGVHEVVVERPHRADTFSAECEDFRHGQKCELKGVLWASPRDDRGVKLIVRVTAANLHGEKVETISPAKEVREVEVRDLVDLDSCRQIREPVIGPTIEKAIRESRLNDYEYEKDD